MSAWNQEGILKHQLSKRAHHRLTLQCRLDRLDARAGFPQLELSWSESESAAVRFVLPSGQNLDQARSWHEEFALLDSVEHWPEMLWRLSRRELREARAEIDGIQQKCREKRAELDQCVEAWTEASWKLLTRGTWTSLQGDELHTGASPNEAMGVLASGERAPFWEWKERAQTPIILAIRLLLPSSSGKRWQIEGRKVSDDLFSSPKGQTAFTTWKRTADIKNQLRLHLISQLR